MSTPRIKSHAGLPISTDWTDAELSAAVTAYIGMLQCELEGKSYVKADVNRTLREGALAGRTRSSVELRMQNISATLYELRIPHITGYLPARNVGSRVKQRIHAVLEQHGISAFDVYIPTADPLILAEKVSALRCKPIGAIPRGSKLPATQTIITTSFVRDPAVKRWVLEVADGICEGCELPAPFVANDGFPYLEVHHVTPLSSHGSDRPSNAAALCPNCHRRCHFSADRDEFKLALYEKIGRLKIEVPQVDPAEDALYVDLK
jgi:5-methylcytosine-specific restriction protein A